MVQTTFRADSVKLGPPGVSEAAPAHHAPSGRPSTPCSANSWFTCSVTTLCRSGDNWPYFSMIRSTVETPAQGFPLIRCSPLRSPQSNQSRLM
jgi:hypothetical protein